MSRTELIFGLATAATVFASWRRPYARVVALAMLALWLVGDGLSNVAWDAQDVVGQIVNVLFGGFIAVWSFYRLRPLQARRRPVWWLLALSLTFAAQNYLHFAEQGDLAMLRASVLQGDALAWAVYDAKHALWVSLCAMNALQLAIICVGPRAHGLIRSLRYGMLSRHPDYRGRARTSHARD